MAEDSSEKGFGDLVYRLARAMRREVSHAISEYELTFAEWLVLRWCSGGGAIISDLADSLVLDKANTSRLVGALDDRGLLKREYDEADRRRVIASLTVKGDKLLKKIDGICREIDEMFLRPLTERQARSLYKSVEAILEVCKQDTTLDLH